MRSQLMLNGSVISGVLRQRANVKMAARARGKSGADVLGCFFFWPVRTCLLGAHYCRARPSANPGVVFLAGAHVLCWPVRTCFLGAHYSRARPSAIFGAFFGRCAHAFWARTTAALALRQMLGRFLAGAHVLFGRALQPRSPFGKCWVFLAGAHVLFGCALQPRSPFGKLRGFFLAGAHVLFGCALQPRSPFGKFWGVFWPVRTCFLGAHYSRARPSANVGFLAGAHVLFGCVLQPRSPFGKWWGVFLAGAHVLFGCALQPRSPFGKFWGVCGLVRTCFLGAHYSRACPSANFGVLFGRCAHAFWVRTTAALALRQILGYFTNIWTQEMCPPKLISGVQVNSHRCVLQNCVGGAYRGPLGEFTPLPIPMQILNHACISM